MKSQLVPDECFSALVSYFNKMSSNNKTMKSIIVTNKKATIPLLHTALKIIHCHDHNGFWSSCLIMWEAENFVLGKLNFFVNRQQSTIKTKTNRRLLYTRKKESILEMK